ncbi:MAG TPA: lipid-A-disaccharide synthase N-terminal domain-containing protein [Micropepsaceae bacterium]|nr:lipid-A-disaccharide synthase N-terminal domain-containing protein [Micropepsaceae bacterium]HRK72575.1 lipid-A-disaccharide synthase N-terminal domain-containing protein [Micropepsaceae bacterium]
MSSLVDWMTTEHVWLLIGFLGQGLFASRFIIQWIRSEQERKSVIPVAFWYFSLLGGLVTLAYAIYKEDPVFITGQASGLLVYSRNLFFIRREKAEGQAAA